MQVLNREQMTEYWTRVRAAGRVRRYPLENAGVGVGYSQQDPHTFPQEGNTYSENLVFGGDAVPLSSIPNSAPLQALNASIAASAPTAGAGLAGGFVNKDSFTVTPFNVGGASVQVLSANTRRTYLLVQNQSATLTLLFNLGNSAGTNQGIQLTAGQGIIFDTVVPNNYVTVAYIGGNGSGVVAEGSRSA